MKIDIQLLDWTQAKPLAETIRREVFIQEQKVPEHLEWDRWDSFALHALVILEGQAVATGRLTREGRIGRMAVLKPHRRLGIGSRVLDALIEAARERQLTTLSLHAQCNVITLYEKQGFISEGDTFMEAGIAHQLMTKTL